jgi:hypothetical protein
MTIMLPRVQKAVADYYHTTINHLKGRSIYKRTSRYRHVAMYLSRTLTEASLSEIGAAFQRDHSTVMAAVRSIEKQLPTNPALRAEIEELRRRLTSSEKIKESTELATAVPFVKLSQCPTCGHTLESAAENERVVTILRMGVAAIEQGIKALERQ